MDPSMKLLMLNDQGLQYSRRGAEKIAIANLVLGLRVMGWARLRPRVQTCHPNWGRRVF